MHFQLPYRDRPFPYSSITGRSSPLEEPTPSAATTSISLVIATSTDPNDEYEDLPNPNNDRIGEQSTYLPPSNTLNQPMQRSQPHQLLPSDNGTNADELPGYASDDDLPRYFFGLTESPYFNSDSLSVPYDYDSRRQQYRLRAIRALRARAELYGSGG
ncbi:uncharacterized protein BDW47DRAFT_81332 [Aspergillus candidus]|uniref:Uncharacterized protein n=1 Tax=Aspergillus candidus TaxID=41067 RepID=A0A2I2FJ78_ASPCN|nr:hypothetical protein BDW47DRAFT_81332 [Aspergillus candidus]PLB40688.1 hypothetical protein BDW47DRAFT_81332 [Aspergillus candidus]